MPRGRKANAAGTVFADTTGAGVGTATPRKVRRRRRTVARGGAGGGGINTPAAVRGMTPEQAYQLGHKHRCELSGIPWRG